MQITIIAGSTQIVIRESAEGRVAVSTTPAQTDSAILHAEQNAVLSARLQAGCQSFKSFLDEWAENFGVVDTQQPDRRKLCSKYSMDAGPDMMVYIRSRGGLGVAVQENLSPFEHETVEDFTARAGAIAGNMVQIGSFGWSALREAHEYHGDLDELRKLPMATR